MGEPFIPSLVYKSSHRPAVGGSPAEALSLAFHDTLRLLARPFDARRWFTLCVVCLFLGGGAPSAAFNWSLGALRNDAGVASVAETVRGYAAHHLWMVFVATALGLGLALGMIYLRAVLRFVLVGVIVDRGVYLDPIWNDVRSLGTSYFLWLMGLLTAAVAALTAAVVVTVRYFRSSPGPLTADSVRLSIATVALLASVALGSLLIVLLLTLTDDVVVPIMFAENLKLPSAWRKLWSALRRELGAFAVYLVLRFTVSLVVGAVLLLFLFPAVLSLFSGAAIGSALVVLAMRLVGLHWVWTRLTITLGAAAVLLLTFLVLVFLSAVGMPGQVLLQNFGIQFAASRFPSLESRWRSPRLRVADWKPARRIEEGSKTI